MLGQPDFTTTTNSYTTQSGFRNPTGIATDGNILVLADTDNNRVLIWKTIPTHPISLRTSCLGQKDFTSVQPIALNNSQFRGPQGVWVQGSQLFVADTQNHRVMIWNSIPTANNQPADLVLGEPNFSTAPPRHYERSPATASNLFSPVSVTSDGQRLFVTDLGPPSRADLEFDSHPKRPSGGRRHRTADHDHGRRQQLWRNLQVKRDR